MTVVDVGAARAGVAFGSDGSALVTLTLNELRGLVMEAAEHATKTTLATLTTAPARPTMPAAVVEPEPEPLPVGWPLAELVVARRAELCLSLAEVARRMHRAAAAEGEHCGITRQAIVRVEGRDRRIPQPSNLRWLAVALELPAERLLRAAQAQRRKRDATARVGLARRRKSLGFSQEAFADRVGVERSTVVRWERGETDPQPWVRPKLASVLEISLDQLNVLLATESTPPAVHVDRSV